ncbi:MAG: hypothetical protein E6J45_10450 [Chloroflexi bacterium]|nr:MAG: hypothetical protein E6J45_10450 [Chloroflexota bacterium]
MRVRDHVVLSTAGAALASPWAGRRVLASWAGGVLIDADHFLWFCVRERSLNPLAAIRLFNEAEAPSHSATRLLHSPVALLLAFLLGTRRPLATYVALGMAVHVAIDAGHRARLNVARSTALRRDGHVCRSCGAREGAIAAHLWRQPALLPSYDTSNFVSLCSACHATAHARAGSWTPPAISGAAA